MKLTFTEAIQNILIAQGWTSKTTPSALLEMYKQFVEDCQSGYEMGIYEYDNDLSVRGVLEEIIQSNDLKQYENFEEFKRTVFQIDEEFRNLLSKDFKRQQKKYWWERGILSRASGEYLTDIEEIYGYKISEFNHYRCGQVKQNTKLILK